MDALEAKDFKGFKIRDTSEGRYLVISSDRIAESLEFMNQEGIDKLEINRVLGYQADNISFLQDFQQIKGLVIIHLLLEDISPIHYLNQLEDLSVSTYCKSEINFSSFPSLTDCTLEWRPKASSLFNCKNLKSLCINRYSGKDTSAFANLDNLENLSILNSSIQNLNGLSGLHKLLFLGVYNIRKLYSLDGIQSLTALHELAFTGCRKITSLEEVRTLCNLKHLNFSTNFNIDTIKPIEDLKYLQQISFYESTNVVDGDLSPLLKLRNLQRVAFMNRRHYSHKREEIESYIIARNQS